jgi:hypothetical protein
MTDKSESQGSNQSQGENTAQSMSSSTPPPRILPKVDPGKTINFRQEGFDLRKVDPGKTINNRRDGVDPKIVQK